ncbi:hypothetical protein LSH36_11g03110 [Paralvinella palmiformis]|uniref:SOCS box domain-containing protein n=1 Tax=Paralvinella palmiformis TaxID=53620 RepID=A0AAD9NGD9_9ANNE|nr:hypothetical protein LSH36_11g03110 [Paralvinella palmiformis]
MSQIVQKALDFLRPHRSHRLYPLCFVSENTRTCAKRIFDCLSVEGELSAADIEEIKKLIDESPKTDSRNIFCVVNWDGFTLLQRAVIGNHMSVVKMLIKKGCDVNAGICSMPLHLACKLGHVHVAQLLLTYGARADIECTACYPEEHKLKTYPDQIYCLAYQPVFTPVMYALCGDHEQVLRLLLHHENSRHMVKTDFLLHEACKMGAQECSRYLLQRYSEQMFQENTEGKTPLQISLVTDAESAMFLMDNGAELKDSVFLTDYGSTLHELYKSKMTLGLVKATKFALEHGFRSHINVRDQEGNTALYVLLRHVGRTVKSNIQSEYDMELQECIKLLLIHGANPNIANHVGESALHGVLADNAARPLYVSRHGQVRRLKPILQEICKVVDILLIHGADPTQRASPMFVSPLYYAIRIFQSLQPDMFIVVKTALKQLLMLLCQENCNINMADSYGLTPFVLLLHTAYKWISLNSTNSNFSKTILPFIGDMLHHFLKRGLEPNAQLSYWTRRMDEAIESNYFKEIILFLNLKVEDDPLFFDHIHMFLIKLMQRGGDPNTLTFTPTYGTPYTLMNEAPNASVTFLLTKALFLQPESNLLPILEIILLFHKTLIQHKCLEFVESILHFVSTDFKSLTLCAGAKKALQALATTPRSLKDLSRIAITTNLEWRLTKRVPRLPLPKVLQYYVINLDM